MITGGSSGIGLAIAERYLQEGAKRVILVGRSYQRLVKAANYLGGVVVMPEKLDQATQEDWDVIGFSEFQEQPEVSLEKKPGSFAAISDTVSLLVGDVSSVDQWERELESQMVNLMFAAFFSLLNRKDP
jgi:NAD(P)-dependent dehydrogenase (short-subunit alcohol dehydrogenase family)